MEAVMEEAEPEILSADSTHTVELGKLALALSKAQGEMEHAHKDGNNPHFNKTYATLAAVWDVCREPLAENELAIMQSLLISTPQIVVMETMLIHSSGQWKKSVLAVKPDKANIQGVGSAITYTRRFTLAGIVGVCPADDDGNEAAKTSDTRAARPYEAAPKPEPMNPVAIISEINLAQSQDELLAVWNKHKPAINSAQDSMPLDYAQVSEAFVNARSKLNPELNEE